MANQPNRWIKAKRESLIIQFGGKCQEDGCGIIDRKLLEFAHISPTKLNGEGRGRKERIYDIMKNPSCYKLLCHFHHNRRDGRNCHCKKCC